MEEEVSEQPTTESKPPNRFEVRRVRNPSVTFDSPEDVFDEQLPTTEKGNSAAHGANVEPAPREVFAVDRALSKTFNGLAEPISVSSDNVQQNDAAHPRFKTDPVSPSAVQSSVEDEHPHAESNQPKKPSIFTPRTRHVSIKSGDIGDACDHDHNSTVHDTHRKFDTTNLKTFGQNTHEAIPNLDFYRQTTNASQNKRPTLDQLHEEKEVDVVKMTEKSNLVDADEVERIAILPTVSKFGWIKGVLVRCLLNIWGVMLFLRLSWVVGQAGIGYGSIIILLSMLVTTITTLSMAAICTNGEVKGGGAYYMISRSLGPEFGGAIGIIFSLANAIAVAMYVVGFAETIRDLLKAGDMLIFDELNDVRIIGVVTVTALLAIAVIGMEWEARAQIVLLIILLISLVNFVIGVFIPPTAQQISQGNIGLYNSTSCPFCENFAPEFRDGETFFSVFGIFFPASTGILAGANISGDLKNPSTAIPKGTLLAILISGLTYLACLWFLGATVVRDAGPGCPSDCLEGLMNSYRVMEVVSAWGPIIIAGIFAATLSSALASLVSAPKIFQAVCKDRIFPYIHTFAKGYGPSEEPRLSYLLAFIIAIGFILIGKLDVIAPLISNFFLMSYTLINYSCFDASLSKSPGWRPAFKYYNMFVSLFGSVLCLVIMFIIQWWAALVTFVCVAILYGYVHYKKPDINWGSSTQAHVYKTSLSSALKLVATKEHIKNFRPQILVLSGTPHSRPALVDFASNISKKISLLICGHVLLPVELGGPRKKAVSQSQVDRVYELMNKRQVKGFYNYVTANSLRDGALSLLQTAGLGKLKPNTLMLGFKRDWQSCEPDLVADYVQIIHNAFDANCGVGILRVSKGLDVSHHITEDELIQASKTKSEQKKSASASAANIQPVKERAATTSSIDEIADGEDEEFDPDDVVMTTFIGNRQLQKAKVPEMNRFHRKQKKGTIDVWWLFDDGGLTLLIPHILSGKPFWQNCKLRVFLAGTKKGELNKEQKNMATLLSKFRIDYQDMEVIPTFGKPPSQTSRAIFDTTIEKFKQAMPDGSADASLNRNMEVTDQILADNKDRTNRNLRTRELIQEKSSAAALIVVTLPMPRKGQPVPLYMTWLECLSRDMPAPVLMLRGNQESVLTFYS
ncbi:solute carrier family 12 member 2-like [Watersipora subatra]|uniref:solute carrier family 12 member 2-like n=1 Tax=Watersipora subatra TaxID=2589382 RepID=UPI00355C4A05